MSDVKFVTIINQTARPQCFNLAPVSMGSISLPPRGRVTILEEELQAHEVAGALKSKPARIAVQKTKAKEAPKVEVKRSSPPVHTPPKPLAQPVAAQPVAPAPLPSPSPAPVPAPLPATPVAAEEPKVEPESPKEEEKKEEEKKEEESKEDAEKQKDEKGGKRRFRK